MRFKNFTLLFLMGIFGLFTTNLFAQQDATIDPADIRYWIGEGENQVVFIVNWNEPDTALAWGYRFAGENVTLKDIMDGIAAVDYRFAYDATSSEYGYWLNDLTFNDGVLDLKLTQQGYASYLVNGNTSWNTFDVQTVVDGEYVKWGDTYCGTMVDPENWVYVWEKEVAAVYPLAEEAMIDPSEILYWVGEGENSAILAVNFAEPQDVCYAWGVHFAAEQVTIKDMMDVIATSDHRFDYHATEEGWLTDITFNDAVNFVLEGYNSMYNVNGAISWLTFDQQPIGNNDFVKWGDYRIGTEIAPWTYVWETPVTPVSVYTAVAENLRNDASLYPNPAESYTLLQLNESYSNATVTVTDLQGRVVRNFTVSQSNEPIRMETESLRAGMYFVTVSDGVTQQTMKLSVR